MQDDEKNQEAWIASERSKVINHLNQEGVAHLGVGEYPVFQVFPFVALWAVQSKEFPGRVGWWAISGDLPTDYISSANDIISPRLAVRAFSRNWFEVSDYMLRGEEHPDYVIGTPEDRQEIGELLKHRAEILKEYADDDDIWDE